ncbi:subtilisin-like protease sbt1.6 [Quercus suber]|uniref:Subtilisin-like protease sbt1.6 n=1 Tax=Quercus suber TaxID=58331 RepID=A0AAW0KQ63_QUESU
MTRVVLVLHESVEDSNRIKLQQFWRENLLERFDGVDEEGEFDAPPPLGLLAFRFCARERDGFSTFLTQSKADTIGKNPSVLAVFEDHRRELHTTRSPQFLGLRNQRGLWSDSDYDSNVIIGLLDTCIWPERRSFLDRNLGGRELVGGCWV